MKQPTQTAMIHRWLSGPLPADVRQSIDRLAQTEDVQHVVVLPDVHLSGDVCTGTALATTHRLYPAAIGNDIGCGMAAMAFAGEAARLNDEQPAARLLARLYQHVPAIRHGSGTLSSSLPADVNDAPLSHPKLEKLKSRDGRVEFATLGRGNHFLEFQTDEEDCLWVLLHSGSRAMGRAISEHHLAQASQATTGLAYLDADSTAGKEYLNDMEWACRFAEASRRAMIESVGQVVGDLLGVTADWSSYLSCNHNHVRREMHDGREAWVHRKGTISAREGEPGIIPGSMGTASFHVTGRGHADSLCSSSHGAGRVMSRSEAFKRVSGRELERQMKGIWFDHRLIDKLRDEAPAVYKDIHKVLKAQAELSAHHAQAAAGVELQGGLNSTS